MAPNREYEQFGIQLIKTGMLEENVNIAEIFRFFN